MTYSNTYHSLHMKCTWFYDDFNWYYNHSTRLPYQTHIDRFSSYWEKLCFFLGEVIFPALHLNKRREISYYWLCRCRLNHQEWVEYVLVNVLLLNDFSLTRFYNILKSVSVGGNLNRALRSSIWYLNITDCS